MIQFKAIRFNLFVMGIMLLHFAGYSQSFEEARNLAFNGEREEARRICRILLNENYNSDVALLMGRTFAWDGMYDSARVVILDVLEKSPENGDALNAIIDVEYWSENYKEAVGYSDRLISLSPGDEAVILKKARILNSSGDTGEAADVLANFIKQYPGCGECIQKLEDYRLDLAKNTFRIAYSIDFFDKEFNRDPWQITSVSWGRKTKIGSLIARVNYANRFGSTGFQYEVDAYPSVGENGYLYANYGFSNNSLFPKNRAGLEWYRNFPKAFEGSIGMRLLDFQSSVVDIYTATLGKYTGNYWISLRSYVTPGETGTSVSGSVTTRRYFSDPENYIGMRISYGMSPDERRNLINTSQRLLLNNRAIRLEYNQIFLRKWILRAGTTVGQEEREQGQFAGYYTLDLSFSYRF